MRRSLWVHAEMMPRDDDQRSVQEGPQPPSPSIFAIAVIYVIPESIMSSNFNAY